MNNYALMLPVRDHMVEHLEHMKEMAVDSWYDQVAHAGATPLGAPMLDVIANPTYLCSLGPDEETGEPIIERMKLIIRVTGSTR